jgi:hypothetical protein
MTFGQKLELVTRQCIVCGRWFALRLDRGDLDLHLKHGIFVQHALPYLSSGDRELVYSGVCDDCWWLLCPADPLEYN